MLSRISSRQNVAGASNLHVDFIALALRAADPPLDVFVAEELTADEEIAFNAGTHTELMKMRYDDYASLLRPTVVRFARQPA